MRTGGDRYCPFDRFQRTNLSFFRSDGRCTVAPIPQSQSISPLSIIWLSIWPHVPLQALSPSVTQKQTPVRLCSPIVEISVRMKRFEGERQRERKTKCTQNTFDHHLTINSMPFTYAHLISATLSVLGNDALLFWIQCVWVSVHRYVRIVSNGTFGSFFSPPYNSSVCRCAPRQHPVDAFTSTASDKRGILKLISSSASPLCSSLSTWVSAAARPVYIFTDFLIFANKDAAGGWFRSDEFARLWL